MRAWHVEAPGPVTGHPLRLHPDDDVPRPGPGELLLRVLACGVCRTDLHVTEGDLPPHRPTSPGVTTGQEVVGEVAALGEGAEGFSTGDRAGAAWLRSTDNTCAYCRRGAENLCPASRYTGWDADGGYAEYMTVPAAYAHRLPEGYSDAELAPLLCAGIIGYHALQRAELPPRGRLGIYGFRGRPPPAAQVALSSWVSRPGISWPSPSTRTRWTPPTRPCATSRRAASTARRSWFPECLLQACSMSAPCLLHGAVRLRSRLELRAYWASQGAAMSKQAKPPPPGDKPAGSAPPPPPTWRNWIWPIMIFVIFGLFFLLPTRSASTSLTYSKFLSDVSAHQVKTVQLAGTTGGTSSGTLTNGKNYSVVIPPQAGPDLLTTLQKDGVQTSSAPSGQGFGTTGLAYLIPFGLPIVIFVWLFRRISRGAAGGLQGALGVGRSRAKVFDEEQPSTTFADVAGYEGAKAEIAEVVDFLKNPGRYQPAGAPVPRGVLMVGPPC